MSAWHRIAAVDDIPVGEARELAAGGRVVALFRTAEGFHAMDGVCPHAGGPLGQGSLDGNIVTCPWHGWQFDVTTGRHCLNDNICHPSFEVKVDGGDVLVAIP